MKKREKIFIYVALVVLFILLVANLFYSLQNDNSSITQQNSQNASIEISDDTTKVVKKVNDSVVTIALYQGDQLVGNGSGSVISKNKNKVKIVTNNHVVDQNEGIIIKVIFSNKKEVAAKVLGKDAVSDLALLEANVNFNVKPIDMGDSDKLQVGESVIAIGSPLDIAFTGTVTKGIISGLNRTIEDDKTLMQFIQTDTSINPGNSGGPLINMAGQMIAINTSKINMTGYEGMGFAIPINEAKNILAQLEKSGSIDRPKLGIAYQPLSNIPEETLQQMNLPNDVRQGLYVAEVNKGSSAANAGIKPEDIIYSVNGEIINSPSVLTSILYSSKKGDQLKLGVYRDGKKQEIIVTL